MSKLLFRTLRERFSNLTSMHLDLLLQAPDFDYTERYTVKSNTLFNLQLDTGVQCNAIVIIADFFFSC